jgi:hypothetical protein
MGQTSLSTVNFNLGSGTVGDEQVKTDANIDADKLQHLYKVGSNFALAIGATPAAREEVVFVASGTASVRAFKCLLNVTGTTTDVGFDLKKNGTSILSAAVNITNAASDRAVQTGTISAASLTAGDVISLSLATTTTTGAQGPFAWVEIEEVAV